MNPEVHLHISNNVTKSGSAVNIICTAESYPPAENVSNYQMRHPKDYDILIKALPGKNGVIHRITAVSKERDAGESLYRCIVTENSSIEYVYSGLDPFPSPLNFYLPRSCILPNRAWSSILLSTCITKQSLVIHFTFFPTYCTLHTSFS